MIPPKTAASTIATLSSSAPAAASDRDEDVASGNGDAKLIQAAAQVADDGVSLTPERGGEVLERQNEVEDSGKGESKLGDQVRFTRRYTTGEPTTYPAIISAVHPAEKAEDENLSEDEAKEVAGLSTRELDDCNLTRDGDTVRRRFPQPAQPETVDLHVFVPIPGDPVHFVERVPRDPTGEQDTSWND